MNAHDKWLESPYERASIDHEALQARIAAEAAAILAECVNIQAAEYFADNWEALLPDRTLLIAATCSILADKDIEEGQKKGLIGELLIQRIRNAAMKRATYECTRG